MRWWTLAAALLLIPSAVYADDGDSETEATEDAEEAAEEATEAAEEAVEAAEEAAEEAVEAAEDATEAAEDATEAAEEAAAAAEEAAVAAEEAAHAAEGAVEPAASTGTPAWMNIPPSPLTIMLPGEFELSLHGRVQARATLFDMDEAESNDPVLYGDPNLREGLSLRRVRLGVGGSWHILSFAIGGGWDNRYDATGELPEAGFGLEDAWLELRRMPEIGLRMGQTKVPFGRQALGSSAELALIERSIMANYMSPERELAVVLSGALGPKATGGAASSAASGRKALPSEAFHYWVSISNGGGDWTGDPDPKPRIGARAQLDLFENWDTAEAGYELPGLALSFGGAGNYDWGLQANTLAVTGDAAVRFWRLSLQGEVAYARAVPTFDTEGLPDILASRESLGWYAQLGVVVIPGWLELAARVDGYDDNRAIDDAGDRIDVSGGATLLMLNGHLKTQLFYVHRSEGELHRTPNDSLILQLQALL